MGGAHQMLRLGFTGSVVQRSNCMCDHWLAIAISFGVFSQSITWGKKAGAITSFGVSASELAGALRDRMTNAHL